MANKYYNIAQAVGIVLGIVGGTYLSNKLYASKIKEANAIKQK